MATNLAFCDPDDPRTYCMKVRGTEVMVQVDELTMALAPHDAALKADSSGAPAIMADCLRTVAYPAGVAAEWPDHVAAAVATRIMQHAQSQGN